MFSWTGMPFKSLRCTWSLRMWMLQNWLVVFTNDRANESEGKRRAAVVTAPRLTAPAWPCPSLRGGPRAAPPPCACDAAAGCRPALRSVTPCRRFTGSCSTPTSCRASASAWRSSPSCWSSSTANWWVSQMLEPLRASPRKTRVFPRSFSAARIVRFARVGRAFAGRAAFATVAALRA